MRVLVVGQTGQLARALAEMVPPDWSFAGRDRADLETPGAAAALIAAERPDAVVNAAAWTAVDLAETEPGRARRVNTDAVAEIAAASAAAGAFLVHVSTDYVFDGTPGRPWREDDPTGPLGVYGATKLAGEEAALAANPRTVIVRTSWVYAPWGTNFVRTILRLAAERDHLKIVDDQSGCPTSALDLARAVLTVTGAMAGADATDPRWGVYHYAGADRCEWVNFAREIAAQGHALGLVASVPRIDGIPTSEYPTPARRPANSVLDCAKVARTFGLAPRPWREALAETLGRIRAMEDA